MVFRLHELFNGWWYAISTQKQKEFMSQKDFQKTREWREWRFSRRLRGDGRNLSALIDTDIIIWFYQFHVCFFFFFLFLSNLRAHSLNVRNKMVIFTAFLRASIALYSYFSASASAFAFSTSSSPSSICRFHCPIRLNWASNYRIYLLLSTTTTQPIVRKKKHTCTFVGEYSPPPFPSLFIIRH